MKILAIERKLPEVADAQAQPYLKPEAARVWELYQAGIVRELYFDRDRRTAVLVLECLDVDSAKQIRYTLPLVKAGAIAFDVIPLVPYPGFSRLFVTE